jgi:hypothetical protein
MQLLFFRSIARGDINIGALGKMYVPGSGRNINDSTRAFIDQVFRPMAQELIRHLRRVGEARAEEPVPAADRVVSLNHNSKEYTETIEAAEEVEKTIREANDFSDPEEKEQRIAEVSAVRRLLQAVRVRIEAIVVLLRPLAEQAKTKLKDNLVGTAVTTFLGLLGTLLHYVWALF